MSSVRQLYLVGSSLGIIIVLIRVIVPQSFDVIFRCFLQSLKGLGFLCMVTLSPSCSASTPRITTRREENCYCFLTKAKFCCHNISGFQDNRFLVILSEQGVFVFPFFNNRSVFGERVHFQSTIASSYTTFFFLFKKPTPP